MLLAPILFFPATLLIPAAAVFAWKHRGTPGVRFALCWLIPSWVAFELLPTKLVHYPLPMYGALAWLAAVALREPIGWKARWSGAALSAVVGLALAGAVVYLATAYGGSSAVWAAIVAGGLFAAAGVVGGGLLLRRPPRIAVTAGLVLGVLGHDVLAAGLVPRLDALWLSRRVETTMEAANLLPRQGIAEAPVAVAGFAEPSLVFALGTPTELHGAADAAQAIAEMRPAVVESREEAAFQRALAEAGLQVSLVGAVPGLNYSNGDEMTLRIYRAQRPLEGTAP